MESDEYKSGKRGSDARSFFFLHHETKEWKKNTNGTNAPRGGRKSQRRKIQTSMYKVGAIVYFKLTAVLFGHWKIFN